MLLRNKTAVIYGGGGAIGSAVARAFTKEGATVFLAGRNLASVIAVANEISAAAGAAEAAQVDALDESAIERHLDDTISKTGGSISASMLPEFQEPMSATTTCKARLLPCSRLRASHGQSRLTRSCSF